MRHKLPKICCEPPRALWISLNCLFTSAARVKRHRCGCCGGFRMLVTSEAVLGEPWGGSYQHEADVPACPLDCRYWDQSRCSADRPKSMQMAESRHREE